MIQFEKLQDTYENYLLMCKWLNNIEVRRWYGYDDFLTPPTIDDIRKKYKHKILNSNESNPNMILINDIPIGYIQYYKTKEYLQEENIYGIDLFIGNDDYRKKRYGREILKQIIKNIFENTHATKILIDPDLKNEIAIKCYLNVGFEKIKIIDNHLIMVIVKEEWVR